MRLFIAEKPSLANVVATALGGGKKSNGFIEVGNDKISWCFGHMYELFNPEDYDPDNKKWSLDNLPIIPDQWQRQAKKDCKPQLKIIKGLLKNATEVVNAGDPDREGQLLIDELLEEMKWKGKTSRLWLTALEDGVVKKALLEMKPNSEYRGHKEAAEARSCADWLVGLNMTRAYTVKAQGMGYKGVLSVGRVQTPTLSLVVGRDRQIEGFKPTSHFGIEAQFEGGGGLYKGTWQIPEAMQDSEGRCLKQADADKALDTIRDSKGVVKTFTKEKKAKKPELPFSLSALQAFNSKKFGLSAQETLDIAQALYETYKATSYPRTDCRYLSEEALPEAAETLKAISEALPGFEDSIKACDISKTPKSFNNKKLTAHTAIVPTKKAADMSKMNENEKKVYVEICKRYIVQFMPDYEFEEVIIISECKGATFKTRGVNVMSMGWQSLSVEEKDEKDDDQEEAQTLDISGLKEGDEVFCVGATCKSLMTKPPQRFNEGSLIMAMASIAKFVDDPEAKKRLKETAGIGTEATRANILETLKKRGYMEIKGKALISTDTARSFVDCLPREITDPVTTASWEQVLDNIATGNGSKDTFLKSQATFVRAIVQRVKTTDMKSIPIPPANQSTPKKAKKKTFKKKKSTC